MNRKDPFPFGEAELLDGMDNLDAGVADQDMDVAISLDGLLHGGFDLGLTGDIHRHPDCPATGLVDLRGDCDLRPLVCKLNIYPLAYAAGGPCNECNVTVEA
jgi:hypothetical protein